MKLIFFGTPDYIIPVLEALKDAGFEIVAIVTQPPKPVGRKQILTPSPADQWAEKQKIQIIHDRKEIVVEKLKALDASIAVLAAYGRIIPQEIIDLFPKGILNIHPSLLPKYRGATPVEAALVAGEKQTGITIIKLDAELDHGPILAQFTEDIKSDDTRVTLRERLFKKGAEIIVKILPDYMASKLIPREQNHEQASFTTLFKKDHGFIPPEYVDAASKGVPLQTRWEIPFIKNYSLIPSPYSLDRFIRAVNPWPGAFTNVKLTIDNKQLERRLKILKAHVEKKAQNTSGVGFDSPEVDGIVHLVLDEVQLEGKNPVSWDQFKKGYPQVKF